MKINFFKVEFGAFVLIISHIILPFFTTDSCRKTNFKENFITSQELAEYYDSTAPLREEKFEYKFKYKVFQRWEQLPYLTETGFKKLKIPLHVWETIKVLYEELKAKPIKEELFDRKQSYMGKGRTSDLLDLEEYKEIKQFIHYSLLPIHEKFCGLKLKPNVIYGIRSYLKDSKFLQHRDRIQTHHIAAILHIDKDLNGAPDWPLDIKAHDGSWHKVYTEPGEMILYESAISIHGRDEIFNGNYFRNLFINYSFVDLIYDA